VISALDGLTPSDDGYGRPMYIGGGAVLLILIIIVVVLLVRR
jgi:hypothetical protein